MGPGWDCTNPFACYPPASAEHFRGIQTHIYLFGHAVPAVYTLFLFALLVAGLVSIEIPPVRLAEIIGP